METQQYEIVIVGTGEGSKFLAWTLGKQGKRIAVIERKYIGGSCPNIACLPTKNVIHSAKVASYFRRSEEFGITASARWSQVWWTFTSQISRRAARS